MHATRMCVCARVGGSVGRHLDGGTHSLGLYLVGETYVGRVRTYGRYVVRRQTDTWGTPTDGRFVVCVGHSVTDAGYRVCVSGKRRPEQCFSCGGCRSARLVVCVCCDRSSSTEVCFSPAGGRKAIILASRRSLVLRVLELPIIHAEDAVQLVPASHLVADAEDIAF